MGASASPLAKTKRSAPPPVWLGEKADEPKKDYTQTHHTFFTHAHRRCQGLIEYALLGVIYDATIGGRGRPRWAQKPIEALAVELGCTETMVRQAITRLAGEEAPMLEVQQLGRDNYYRVLPENFDHTAVRPLKKLAKKEPEVETEVRHVPPTEALILQPGKSRPFVLASGKRVTFNNWASAPHKVHFTETEEGDFDFAIYDPEADEQRNSSCCIGLQNGKYHSATPVAVLSNGSVENKKLTVFSLTEFLNRKFDEGLMQQTDEAPAPKLIESIHRILVRGSVPLAQFDALIDRKRSKIRTPGFLVHLAEEAALSHNRAAWDRAHKRRANTNHGAEILDNMKPFREWCESNGHNPDTANWLDLYDKFVTEQGRH
jgi:hypothetical protein